MDSIKFYDIKAEKANAIVKYRKLRKIANLFRFIEVLVVLLLLSRVSVQLPHAVKNSGPYFKDISGFIVSPRFVFVIGNAIVIILFAKSGKFSSTDSSTGNSGADIYDEFLQNSERNQKLHRHGIGYQAIQNTPPEAEGGIVSEKVTTHSTETPTTSVEVKTYTRSQSENLDRGLPKNSRRLLRRSDTEKLKKNVQSGERLAGSLYPEDGMSSDEFRSKVEAFIARQQKFRLQEEYSVI